MDFTKYTDQAVELLMVYGPKVILAIVVLIIGLWIIRGLIKLMDRAMTSRGMDPTIRPFLKGLFGVLLKIMLFISVASMIGIATTSFIAVLGAAGLAVGLALQGSLANFAGGVLILLFKPYKVGDLIEAQGHFGEVTAIQIFNTILTNPDNKTIIMPNGAVSNGSIVNFTTLGKVRVDLTIGISYNDNIGKARQIIMDTMTKMPIVLKDPAPSVAVRELGESSVDLAVRPYATVDDYWDVYFGTLENCKIALDDAGITIPYPQRDVHVRKDL